MKILVVGDVFGRVDLINEYLKKSDADIALCTGEIGIGKKNDWNAKNPYYFDIHHEFFGYMSGKKKFIKPVISTYGRSDNFSEIRSIFNGATKIENFTLLQNGEPVSVKNNTQDELPISNIKIAGIGGVYSPKSYKSDSDNYLRHFHISHIEKLQRSGAHILLMHDLIGGCTKKRVMFSEDTYRMLESINPLYCFVGNYHWFTHAKILGTRMVVMPKIQSGYLLIDTNNEWNAEASFNLNEFQQ